MNVFDHEVMNPVRGWKKVFFVDVRDQDIYHILVTDLLSGFAQSGERGHAMGVLVLTEDAYAQLALGTLKANSLGVAWGTSVRNLKDRHDVPKGIKIALTRAFERSNIEKKTRTAIWKAFLAWSLIYYETTK